MAGICSAHRHYEPTCRLCNANVRDLIPDYDEMVARAKDAGERTCPICEFVYFKTTDMCPSCSYYWWETGEEE